MNPDTINQIVNGLGDVALLVGGILAIEWIFLPFAIFGIKSKLDDIREGIATTNNLLEKIAKQDDDRAGL